MVLLCATIIVCTVIIVEKLNAIRDAINKSEKVTYNNLDSNE